MKIINKIKELINVLDSNKIKCFMCRKWINKKDIKSYSFISSNNVCIKCWKKFIAKLKKKRKF
jgi:hypothetical protein